MTTLPTPESAPNPPPPRGPARTVPPELASRPQGVTRREAIRRVGLLLGGVVSAPTVAAVLSGCQRIAGPDWTPETLTFEQDEIVAALAEIILPETDTPGARAANVNRFVDALLTGSFPPEDRDRFLEGLDDLDARCREDYAAPFLECTDGERLALVGELDDETFGPDAPERDPEAPSFYRMAKELVVVGYYTSEVGAARELRTELVPGRYDGDVPYDEIGRAWA